VSRRSVPALAVPPPTTPERALVLAEAAAGSGARWAQSERESLRAEGRRAEGGWPGTLSEARDHARVAMGEIGGSLTYEELSWMTRAVYDSARRDWLAASDPPGPES